MQSDGKAVVGGKNRNGIARVQVDGNVDATFDGNVNGYVFALAQQLDGKTIVVGGFSLVGIAPNFPKGPELLRPLFAPIAHAGSMKNIQAGRLSESDGTASRNWTAVWVSMIGVTTLA